MLDLTIPLNGISAVCALSVIILFFGLRHRDKSITNRVSLRLQTGIALIDIVKHIIICTSFKGDDSFACSFKGFILMSFAHIYLFMNVSIALNLNLVVLLEMTPRKIWERLYWMGIFVFTALLDVPLLALGVFGVSFSKQCFIKNGVPLNDLLEMIYYPGLTLALVVYCIIISVLVVIKMYREKPSHVPEDVAVDPNETWDRIYSVFGLQSLICRTAIYPAVCFICNIALSVHIFNDYFGGIKLHGLLDGGYIALFLTGTFNLLAFLVDPLVWKNIPYIFKSQPPQIVRYERDSIHDYQKTPIDNISYHFLITPSSENGPSSAQRCKMVKDFVTLI